MKRLLPLLIMMFLIVVSAVSAQTSESKRPPRPATTTTTTNNPTTTKPATTATQSKPQQSTQTRSSGSTKTFTVNGVSFTMVYVEGGTFTMGATSEQGNDAEADSKPVHSVAVSSYFIGQTEVTQALGQAVMGSSSSYFEGGNLPVDMATWDGAQEFVRKLNNLLASQLGGMRFRLPTEAEWEFAARGGNKSRGYKYSGSNDINSVAWYKGNSGETTHEVKTKSPNELGLYDMSGNVNEWCQDWYGNYSNNFQTNPKGPSGGSRRVLRGGCSFLSAECCRSSYRNCAPSDYFDFPIMGLRLVLSE